MTKPKRITGKQYQEIRDALEIKATELSFDLLNTIHGAPKFFSAWSHKKNASYPKEFANTWHFVDSPCSGCLKSKTTICLASVLQADLKTFKYYLHEHRVGECPWRIYH